ncbi:MAG: hypothetical protein O3A94_10785 [Proteobacteria bacterium]|nr:hypothetical protein [Pseudomonadota bacterium]
MTLLSSLTFVEYKATSSNPTLNRRRKLAVKIEEQERIAADADYVPTKQKWVKGADGVESRVAAPKRVKRWWTHSSDGGVLLTLRYGSKPIEFVKGKSAIALKSEADVAPTLSSLKQAVLEGELDTQIEALAAFGRKVRKGR